MGQEGLGRNIYEEPLAEFKAHGGDPRFLERLLSHPALKILERLDTEERRRVELGAKLSAVEKTLGQAMESISSLVGDLQHDGVPQEKGNAWLANIRQAVKGICMTKVGISGERYLLGKAHRRGLLMSHPERYFLTAALIPYTTLLAQKRGKKPIPDWDWIERWLREVLNIQPEKDLCLRAWWHKEVLRRSSWPPRPLMYALCAGAAVYLEASKSGTRAGWTIERDNQGRPLQHEDHPCKLKRTLTSADMTYLAGAFRFIPLVRDDFKRLYKQTTDLASGMPPNPLDALIRERVEDTISKLPLKARLWVAIDRGEVMSLQDITKRLKAEAGDKLSGKGLRQLARLTRENLLRAQAKSAGAPGGKSRAER